MKLKILVLVFFCFGCVDHNPNKTNLLTDKVSLSSTTDFIKAVNHPYFVSTFISKTISKKDLVFFDGHLNIKKEKNIPKNQYFIDLTQDQSKCCFKTIFTAVLILKTKAYDLQINFNHNVKIKFLGYQESKNEMVFYFKMNSENNSNYLNITKKTANKKFVFEITDYLKINDNLY
ncbi:hypothetical protein C4F50_12175 [Flavobacterium sp. KB82]|uniref:Lipoprotein n=2 Tax=Flavobacterium hungaricum TaxID=2082725 RepID=A0ABR9TK04_9FLAO|nr:hypothetical protein [Flavobacterium hungaricum]